MRKFQLTVSLPDTVPEGTGLLCVFAELIKEVPNIVDRDAGRVMEYMQEDWGDIEAKWKWKR